MSFCVPKSTTVGTCSQHIRKIFVDYERQAVNVVLFNCIKYKFNLVILIKMTKLKLSLFMLKSILGLCHKLWVILVAVKNRMDAMEKKGIIGGYQTVINNNHMPTGVQYYR